MDKCRFLTEHGAKFDFIKTESSTFGDNLKLIDSKLDEILAQMLLLFYEKNEKEIKELLSLIIKESKSETYYKKKMGDFANAVTFGMRVSEAWDGINEVNGGIIITS